MDRLSHSSCLSMSETATFQLFLSDFVFDKDPHLLVLCSNDILTESFFVTVLFYLLAL